MTINETREFAFAQSLINLYFKYPLYVINGSKSMQDKAVNFAGYLLLIDANGDTIAGCSPGSEWCMYPSVVSRTHPNISSNLHAICIP
ncbi:hypothetical protein SJZ86_01380 [Klebsiella aerogenes]|uniref:hypothetical protein n=1 Tax=Klebsiella aerogenes TaxID=548 RepID=UPI0029D75A12|nr:hypothetical protein [Klebsiella aerogenes]MDX6889118.1 hypothetical protein [Klebsiella aerogenes]